MYLVYKEQSLCKIILQSTNYIIMIYYSAVPNCRLGPNKSM